MHNLLFQIRYALRQFRLAPMFTASAVLTLALGIGGTTAIFTLIHAVMLRSLPVADPASLYRIGDGNDCCVQSGPQDRWGMYSFPLYERLKSATPELEDVAAFQAAVPPVSVRRESAEAAPRPLRSEYVTGNYFLTLGIRAFGGRLFTPEDDTESSAPVAVLSHHAWQLNYGSDSSILGSTLAIEGHPFTVIGITPPGFFGETLRSDPPDLWIPLHQEPMMDGAGARLHESPHAWLRAIGRLRPGASVTGMAPRLTGVLRQWLRHDSGYPANWMADVIRSLPRQFINVVPAGAGVALMKEQYSANLQILLAVCGLVLLISCANVANLLLARAMARRGQIALRLAIGATRKQIVAQALTESILLALGGGLAGLLVAVGASRILLALAFQNAHFLPVSVRPSIPVLAFAFALALITGMVFGAAPAWFATRTDPIEALRGSSRSFTGRSSFARKSLLVLQFGISVVLVAGAIMLARSLGNLEGQDFGYPVKGRVMVQLHNPQTGHSPAELDSIYREIEDRITQIPGVPRAGLALYNPLTNNWGEPILVQGHDSSYDYLTGGDSGASWDRVSTDYLQALGVALVSGRYFTSEDSNNTAPVAIVNQAFVKHFFKPGEEPLGQHFGMDLPENAGTYRIVGVVRDAKFATWAIRRPALSMFYVPLAQTVQYKNAQMQPLEFGSHFVTGIILETNISSGQIEQQVTRILADFDPDLTITSVRTLQQQVELSFNNERAVATLAGLFGIVALLLAAVGLYGVTAYTVAQRTNEIGVRMALGADRASVVQLILRGAFQRVLIGLLVGIPLALAAGRLLGSKLYGVSSWDPLALTVAAGALAICSLAAAIIPAVRAASVSPTSALHTE